MGSKRIKLSSKAALPFKVGNKLKRQDLYAKQKKAREAETRDERMRRKREEEKDPKLREERRSRNIPLTIDRKRTWDNVDEDVEDGLGVSVDLERLKRQKREKEEEDAQAAEAQLQNEMLEDNARETDEDHDSMIDSDSDSEGNEEEDGKAGRSKRKQSLKTPTERATSPAQSTTSTNLVPEALETKFPSLFANEIPEPKILVTTSLNSTLHQEAELLTDLFPNSTYIRRSQHRFSHKYSVREISSFAANRGYTAVIVLNEDQKTCSGLDIVHLPVGPMFHFTMTNWIPGKKIPGHGKNTGHYPELNLQNFLTPLGRLTGRLFQTLFPPQPEFIGRQIVTVHNSRDNLFVRRHRYVFREKRDTEKAVIGNDGKEMAGAEGLKVGLQEIGPRFTLRLRRVDKGIQRASGQEWEWKGRTDKIRTRFQL